MSNFNPNVPTGLVKLDQDYANLQKNNQQLDTSFAVNHYAFSSATNNGKHNILQFPTPQGAAPATPGVNEIALYTLLTGYAQPAGTIDINYRRPSGGTTETLLRTGVTLANALNGTSLFIGGVIVQWNFESKTSQGSGTVTFPRAFPNICHWVGGFPVYNSALNTPSTNANVAVDTNTLSKTKFDYEFITPSTKYSGFIWLAFGN